MLDDLFAGLPTPAAQAAVLEHLRQALAPLQARYRLGPYALRPGVRLRRAWGRCQYQAGGRPPTITVRCTPDGDRRHWRRPGAIVATLLHELAHLRERGHGPRFWVLHRRLLDEAAALGVYDPALDDPTEGARGDEKLAGSAAAAVAEAARARRREQARANRAAARAWGVGHRALVAVPRGPLAGARVEILDVARSWVTVRAEDGRRYRVLATALQRPEVGVGGRGLPDRSTAEHHGHLDRGDGRSA